MYNIPDDLMKNVFMCIENATHGNISFIQVAKIMKKLSDCKVEEGE